MDVEHIEFPAEGAVRPFSAPGRLRLGGTKAAVVIVHGSSGPDSRGPAYAEALARCGLTTLEIDMWSPRGLKGGLDRPRQIAETFPDIFGAFRYLTCRPEVDALRIGILGFSWGGVLAMLSATRGVARRYLRNGERFAAHGANYPVCWLYNSAPDYEFRDLTGAPILLQCGGADDYDPTDAPQKLIAGLDPWDRAAMRLIVHPGATHAFDQVGEPAKIVTDPLAHGGKGGEVAFTPDPAAGQAAREAAASFFREALLS